MGKLWVFGGDCELVAMLTDSSVKTKKRITQEENGKENF